MKFSSFKVSQVSETQERKAEIKRKLMTANRTQREIATETMGR